MQNVRIVSGPASGLTIHLLVPSELADKICHHRYEPHSTEICELLIRPKDVCFDIGAHYGYYTLLLSRLAGKGQVFAFEPVERLADSIRKSIRASKLSNVNVATIALSGESGETILRHAQDDSCDDSMNYLAAHGGITTERSLNQYNQFAESVVVCKRLDDLEYPAPNFIKMDVEGAEAAILEGGEFLLTTARPRLLVELHGVDLTIQVHRFLTALGYMALPIGPRDLMMPVLFVHRTDEEATEVLQKHFGKDLFSLPNREHRSGY